jgi:hypothetical protein
VLKYGNLVWLRSQREGGGFMRRKKFSIEDWKGGINLLIAALKDHNKSYEQIIVFRSRLVKIDELSKKDRADLADDLEVFCNALDKDVWEVFLKKCRDERYEKNSSRRRLSVHTDTLDELNIFIDTNGFDNANQAIGYLLKKCSGSESTNRKVDTSSKQQEESSYVPVVPRVSIK